MIYIQVTSKLSSLLRRIEKAFNNFHTQEVYNTLASTARANIRRTFEREGGNKKWVRLSDVTVEIKRKKGSRNPNKILSDSGDLLHSILLGSPSGIYKVDTRGKSIEIGTSLPYAELHQEGGINSSGRSVRKRAFIDLTEEDIENIRNTAEIELEQAMEEILGV